MRKAGREGGEHGTPMRTNHAPYSEVSALGETNGSHSPQVSSRLLLMKFDDMSQRHLSEF